MEMINNKHKKNDAKIDGIYVSSRIWYPTLEFSPPHFSQRSAATRSATYSGKKMK